MTIEAHQVPEHARIEALPTHFGRRMLTVERRVYDFMAQFASAYSGGCWRYFELDNGGFYMSPPDGAYDIHIDSNGFQGRMSADAAGIMVCLFTFSQLSFEYSADTFAKHFHWLRDFVRDHAEAVANLPSHRLRLSNNIVVAQLRSRHDYLRLPVDLCCS